MTNDNIKNAAVDLLRALGNPREPYSMEIQIAVKAMHYVLDKERAGLIKTVEPAVHHVKAEFKTPNGHTLWQDGDQGIPEAIRGRNGEVVLALCKVCGKGEAELVEPCSKREIELLKADKIALKEGYDYAMARGAELVKESEAKSKEIARLNELLNVAYSDIDTYATSLKSTIADSEAHQNEKAILRSENRTLRDTIQYWVDKFGVIKDAVNKP